jgi:hypothetical protein
VKRVANLTLPLDHSPSDLPVSMSPRYSALDLSTRSFLVVFHIGFRVVVDVALRILVLARSQVFGPGPA